MIGKIFIFITAFSFFSNIHHVQSEQSNCMLNDIKTHLDDLLLEEHMFEIKVFSPETTENELLSVINTLCSTWTKNKKKDKEKILVIKTFELMLNNFSENLESFCRNLSCTDAYTLRQVNTVVFGDMYRRSCNGSILDLKCPSQSTTFFTTVDSMTSAHTSSTSLTTVSPNIPASEISSASNDSHAEKLDQNLWSKCDIKTCSAIIVVSLLLNIVLFLLILYLLNQQVKLYQKNKATIEDSESVL